MIGSFKVKENGYHPFLIKEGWQVARLNYMDDQHIGNITQLDVHLKTDEVFVSLRGNAVLIAASIVDDKPVFELELMHHKKIYNIPKNVWHNIAMQPGSEVLIAEKANTHISDFEHLPLSDTKQEELKTMVNALFNPPRNSDHSRSLR